MPVVGQVITSIRSNTGTRESALSAEAKASSVACTALRVTGASMPRQWKGQPV